MAKIIYYDGDMITSCELECHSSNGILIIVIAVIKRLSTTGDKFDKFSFNSWFLNSIAWKNNFSICSFFRRDCSNKASREVWRPEEVNKWGRVKDKHPLPLYQYAIGPACRAVHLTATLLKINLNLLEVRPEIDSYKDVRFENILTSNLNLHRKKCIFRRMPS